ncbi:MAG: Rpn family recombination-promoting nuclease/putative transposase, partial [Prochlorothrix sp.]|nr:Rpn family recombination-promoting nuclease/putative transposase [Prochlorothrix sp.]
MTFLDPKTDFAFKKIFGSPQSKPILIEFLNAFIYQGASVIQDLEILDPYQSPQLQGIKDTFLDVKAQLQEGETVLIEMQVLNPLDFNKRVLYNVAKAYSLQLQRGQGYSRLRPVIGLTITDFVLFPERDRPLSHYQLLDREDGLPYGDDIQLIFVELPKFTKSLEDLETLADQWMFFLQQTATLDEIPPPLQQNPNFDLAFHIAETANLSREEFELLERRALAVEDSRNVVRRALLEGLEQGLEQGLQQGLERGLQQGLQQAREAVQESRRDIARSL